jgi:tRNA modification GTPase
MTKDKNRILIGNKMDLKEEISLPGMIYISAKNKEGLDALALRIEEVTKIDSIDSMNGYYLNNTRQTSLMQKAMESLTSAKNAMDLGYDISLIEIDIKNAFDYLGEITGEANPDELITSLFTKFCLGK